MRLRVDVGRLREMVQQNEILIECKDGRLQLADVLTKEGTSAAMLGGGGCLSHHICFKRYLLCFWILTWMFENEKKLLILTGTSYNFSWKKLLLF